MMSITTRSLARSRAFAVSGSAVILALALAACGSSDDPSMSGMHHGHKPSASASASQDSSTGDMPDMARAADGNGLADNKDGYRLASPDTTLKAGKPTPYRFVITDPDGTAVTDFALDQTKRMHFYAIRSDLTGFQHLHPAMASDGTWTAALASLAPGSWRMFASFSPDSGSGKGKDFVMSRTVTVPGAAARTPLPAVADSTQVDGYTLTVSGQPTAGTAQPLAVRITKDGKAVTDLQPYLDTYAHLTAFHEGDAAFAHLHPTTSSGKGSSTLSFHAELGTPGDWRLFLQFRTGGKLHTAALTLHAG
ncbi:hypothetical protein AB0L71_10135 [Streptomyces sp. NPDC052052]|uniref:hypothetical protein n=1 Tax=Streptomyces sp. NPDC052052 TaxID=3154756 RepID=UPI0034326EB1